MPRHGPTIPASFEVAGLADFDGTAAPTICFIIRARAKQQFVLNNNLLIGNAAGPTIWAGWSVGRALTDLSGDLR